MNDDLISRKALKKALNFVYDCDYIGSKSKEGIALDIIEKIDNALTVEVPEDTVNCILTMFGNCSYNKTGCSDCEIKDKIRKALNKRPHGEWIYGEDEHGQDGWFCSECRFFVPWYYEFYENDIDFIREYKACPHCLADMVTYTGKDRDMKGGRE